MLQKYIEALWEALTCRVECSSGEGGAKSDLNWLLADGPKLGPSFYLTFIAGETSSWRSTRAALEIENAERCRCKGLRDEGGSRREGAVFTGRGMGARDEDAIMHARVELQMRGLSLLAGRKS